MAARSVVCAVDFSDGSRTALRYAAVVSTLIDAQLVVLTVTDALLVEAAGASGRGDWPETQAYKDLRTFCAAALGDAAPPMLLVRVGQPAQSILEVARELAAALVVMGAQGLTGLRKSFFGSTAERVLRDTTVPVLVTPTDCHAPGSPHDLTTLVRRIIVPLDLSPASTPQARIASAIGGALRVPVLLLHAVEPLSMPLKWREQLPSVDMERRMRAEAAMEQVRADAGIGAAEAIVAFGEPSEEIAKAASARGAGLVVMGLQASDSARVGSVTYRVLSLARVPVLALPARAVADLARTCERPHSVETA
jgi:nucleotide-binding universal stress UspA family protein